MPVLLVVELCANPLDPSEQKLRLTGVEQVTQAGIAQLSGDAGQAAPAGELEAACVTVKVFEPVVPQLPEQ